VTQGIISAKGRNFYLGTYDDFLQTDAAFNPSITSGSFPIIVHLAPGKIEHPRPTPRRHLPRPVRRAGVHHDNLIAQPLDRIQTPAQRLGFIADDQRDSEIGGHDWISDLVTLKKRCVPFSSFVPSFSLRLFFFPYCSSIFTFSFGRAFFNSFTPSCVTPVPPTARETSFFNALRCTNPASVTFVIDKSNKPSS